MRRTPIREVEHKRRTGPDLLVIGLAVFALMAVLLWGKVKVYELQRDNLRMAEELARQEDALARLRLRQADGPDLYARAESLGLRLPTAEQTVILHIRGS